jgi:hypothetical protein
MILTEKQQRNRLRKQELSKTPAASYLERDSLKKYTKVLERRGFRVFVDQYVDPKQYDYIYYLSMSGIAAVHKHFRKIGLPIVTKKVPVIFSDFSKNPEIKGVKGLEDAPAYYYNKAIYMDQYSVDVHYFWIHEYAHYLSYIVPNRFVEYATEEYRKMLTEYFKHSVGKKTRRENLESSYYDNPKHREMMANKLGLPSPYSTTNMDEFFAEMISHWHEIPNNKLTFRLKKVMRQILQRF